MGAEEALGQVETLVVSVFPATPLGALLSEMVLPTSPS